MIDTRKQYKAWLNRRRWRAARAAAIRAADGMCRDCLAAGRARAASEVHHVRPVLSGKSNAERERLMYDPGNLVPLCADCHRRRHLELRSHDAAKIRERGRAIEESIVSDLFNGGEE